ncbi:hypothetical protein KY290_011748 [Solanum tuberosum]|uniref:F-ATPase protein 6 n=1 Tax=Solanum tuberosum TaxID=4113 RepID=A0ABQ7W1K2_SOLTU|nr:hypothetical protein KY289_028901 [Solanum tuberosum]KAH0663762.1 hypothetical protein KY284_028693 [Solanum tuberosum]KAH0667506.1 hypothetical protein KY285_028712 [Solanum tuberosum]KAH0672268.1 hypothetical protein KY284_023355 [Solanum tuberosum]KAH0734446.1 hypothetical protein KY285_010153 [Solanum tuberosum]
MFPRIPRIFSFDEESLNSSATSATTSLQSTTTINDSSNGIFEDFPGLNPSSERIVELQSDIWAKLGELMPNKSAQEVLEAAEVLHGESNDIDFLDSLLKDLNQNGVAGEAYKDAVDLGGGNSVPNAWQSLVELIYDFVLNPVNEQIGGLSGNVKQKFSPRISLLITRGSPAAISTFFSTP